MAKTTIEGTVEKIFDEKRQNALYIHRFIRVKEKGTKSTFDVQFYNEKRLQIEEKKIKVGDQVLIEALVNGKFWQNDEKTKEGVFVKINGQTIDRVE